MTADADLQRLDLHLGSMFATAPSGRILREGPPDGSPAPRLCFAGCAGGNMIRLRDDVRESIADRACALANAAPPWFDIEATPAILAELAALLSQDAPARVTEPALIFELPRNIPRRASANIVRSGTPEGAALLAPIARDGVPPHLRAAGFVGLGDFWEPWCAAMEKEEIAAMAFAARLGAQGADIGVYTFPAFRGRGLAGAVTAAWSSLPALGDRALFYSTHRTNAASRRVAERLGLRRFGLSLRVG